MILENEYFLLPNRDMTELGTVHLIFWGWGVGGGGWDILEKKFLALILTKTNKLAQWHSEKK